VGLGSPSGVGTSRWSWGPPGGLGSPGGVGDLQVSWDLQVGVGDLQMGVEDLQVRLGSSCEWS